MDMLSDFDFSYPESAVALRPAPIRDQSALFVLSRGVGVNLKKSVFNQLPNFLKSGDVLVRNATRVIPVRFQAKRPGGGVSEIFVVANADGESIRMSDGQLSEGSRTLIAMISRSSRLRPGVILQVGQGVEVEVREPLDLGRWRITVRSTDKKIKNFFSELGRMPVPPYLRDKHQPNADDAVEKDNISRYQTVFARQEGSIAAPTAGLHFTPAVDAALAQAGVEILELVLHVSMGTFQVIRDEDFRLHRMEKEFFHISPAVLTRLREAKKENRRIIAVGSTVTRTLETVIRRDPSLSQTDSGWTDLFIYPEFEFKIVSGLVTNFHLPKSSLLLMVSAFAGREKVLQTYTDAIAQGARLFSYGDAMLIL